MAPLSGCRLPLVAVVAVAVANRCCLRWWCLRDSDSDAMRCHGPRLPDVTRTTLSRVNGDGSPDGNEGRGARPKLVCNDLQEARQGQVVERHREQEQPESGEVPRVESTFTRSLRPCRHLQARGS